MASSSSAAAVTDASFLNGAGRVDTYEEVKAPEDLETGTPASANILPLEIEDGAAGGKKGDKAEGGKVLEGDGAAVGTPKPAKSFCARHWGKLLCLGVVLALVAIAGIVTPLMWYKEPTAELLSQSNLRIDGSGSLGVDIKLKINNPNRYPVAFENLALDIYDMNGVHVGQVTRKERQRVPARGSAVTTAKATIQASIIELFAMGIDCIANDNHTKLRIKGTADGRLSGKHIKQVVGPFEEMTQCVTLNVNGPRTGGAGGAGAAGGAGGAGGQQPGIGNGQIIQEIGNAINSILGGGRPAGGAAAPPAPAAAAPAPGAN